VTWGEQEAARGGVQDMDLITSMPLPEASCNGGVTRVTEQGQYTLVCSAQRAGKKLQL